MIGCQPVNSPVMKLSVEAGKIVEFDSKATLSDGSAGGVEEQARGRHERYPGAHGYRGTGRYQSKLKNLG